jgi:RsiW-degrading membrane proteinase PrsW (M82 family)
MLQQMVQFFNSAFNFPGLSWTLILLAVALGLAFGAFWLAAYRPPLIRKPWLWGIGIVSAFLTWAAIAFIQIPLQELTGMALLHFWSPGTLMAWLLLAAIPQILLSGLVQEGAKLVPTVFVWWRRNRILDPKLGLIAAAVAGAGFGVFEAVWVHNSIFASGWGWQTVQAAGFPAILGFWERFITVAFHTAVSALAGYGLAKGLGWQFYLIASFLHAATNYSVVFLQNGALTSLQTEVYITVLTLAVIAAALWLRWHRTGSIANGDD